MDLAPGTVVADRYAVQRRLGEGGMAVVYEVTHQQLGTRHALKVLAINQREVRARIVQEGRLQATLRHPNIVAVTDIVEVESSPALVMELIEGPPLDELLQAQRLTIDQADAIGRGVLAAVAHAHAGGLVHRDLKPANILLEVVGHRVIPKVADFGLAKLLDSDGDTQRAVTRTGSTMGTPQYMSPEQIRDAKHVDHRSDLFALGAILYELVTGDRAFDGPDLLDIFNAVASGRYPPVAALRPDAPERMVRAIGAALQVERDARPPDVAALFALWTDGEQLPTAAVSLSHLPALPRRPEATNDAPAATVTGALVLGGGLVGGGLLVAAFALVFTVALLTGWGVWTVLRPPAASVTAATDPMPPTPLVPAPPAPPRPRPPPPSPTDPVPDAPSPPDPLAWTQQVGPDNVVLDPQPAPAPASPEPTPSPPQPPPPPGGDPTTASLLLLLDRATPDERPALYSQLVRHWSDSAVPLEESAMPDLLQRAAPAEQIALLTVYGRRGSSVQIPAPWLGERGGVGATAVDALVAVATRHGTEDEALRLLAGAAPDLSARTLREARRRLTAR